MTEINQLVNSDQIQAENGKNLLQSIPRGESCSNELSKNDMKKPALKREFATRHVHIAIRPSVYEILKGIADQEEVSVSSLISYLVELEAYRRSK